MERRERRVDAAEGRVRLLGAALEEEARPGAEEEDGVGAPVRVRAGVVVDALPRQAPVVELRVELLAEAEELAEVERAEVEEEVPVHELIVRREEVRVGGVARRGAERDVEQPPRDDLDRAAKLVCGHRGGGGGLGEAWQELVAEDLVGGFKAFPTGTTAARSFDFGDLAFSGTMSGS